jgi:hypothetical protein
MLCVRLRRVTNLAMLHGLVRGRRDENGNMSLQNSAYATRKGGARHSVPCNGFNTRAHSEAAHSTSSSRLSSPSAPSR